MKYVCKPIEVDAFQILQVLQNPVKDSDIIHYSISIEEGEIFDLPPEMTSRMVPQVGDYYVKTHMPNEYQYLNPKDVFEAKYEIKTKLSAYGNGESSMGNNNAKV